MKSCAMNNLGGTSEDIRYLGGDRRISTWHFGHCILRSFLLINTSLYIILNRRRIQYFN